MAKKVTPSGYQNHILSTTGVVIRNPAARFRLTFSDPYYETKNQKLVKILKQL